MKETESEDRMKISTRGRYALRMMIDLAEHYNGSTLNDIAKRQNISKKYLEQIIPFLNRSNLLLTNRGNMGGYQLARSPVEITVEDILVSAEGNLYPVSCMENNPNACERVGECLTLPIWEGLYTVISQYLQNITLQDILNKKTNELEYFI